MVNSGSSANLLMVEAMLRGTDREARWQPGDEVLVPALVWPPTVWPLVQLGLTPVFTDIDPGTLAIDLASAENVLSDRTRGMFLIHVLGQPPDMAAVAEFNAAHGIELLEDTCEALGSHAAGQHAGTIGHMGSFSFYFSHHLTTIEGGMVTTPSEAVRDDLRSMRSHGWARDRGDRQHWVDANPQIDSRFLFIGSGYNLRPTEINAAIGLVQLDRLEDMLAGREDIASSVAGWVDAIPWLRLIGSDRLGAPGLDDRSWRRHSWMMLAFEVAEDAPLDPAGGRRTPRACGDRDPTDRRRQSRPASCHGSSRVPRRRLACHGRPDPGARLHDRMPPHDRPDRARGPGERIHLDGAAMRTLVVLPSFNEVTNIQALIDAILGLDGEIEVCVVDDSSPDGTADLVTKLIDTDADWQGRVQLIVREGKGGRGGAVRDGIAWGIEPGVTTRLSRWTVITPTIPTRWRQGCGCLPRATTLSSVPGTRTGRSSAGPGTAESSAVWRTTLRAGSSSGRSPTTRMGTASTAPGRRQRLSQPAGTPRIHLPQRVTRLSHEVRRVCGELSHHVQRPVRRREQRRPTRGDPGPFRTVRDCMVVPSHQPMMPYVVYNGATVRLLAEGNDVVIGARFPDGKIIGWPRYRRIFSRLANYLARGLLEWSVADYTNGYRFYSPGSAATLVASPQVHPGFIYLSESLAYLMKSGASVASYPITFRDRSGGESSADLREVTRALSGLFGIAWWYRVTSR